MCSKEIWSDLEDERDFCGTEQHDVRPAVEAAATLTSFSEPCPKCRGTGQFTSYSGRAVGPCFTCKGKGSRSFKTSKSDRAKAREQTAARKEKQQDGNWQQFVSDEPSRAEWIRQKAGSFDFADSLYASVMRYGSLTDKQLAAIDRCIGKDADRQEQREAEKRDRPSVDISNIKAQFDGALERGLNKRALLFVHVARDDSGEAVRDEAGKATILNTIKLTPAALSGANPGAVYVKVDGNYVGKLVEGKFFGWNAPAWLDTELQRVAANPDDEARFYGQQTGSCSVCGRELTNKISIDLGIGPICRERYGW